MAGNSDFFLALVEMLLLSKKYNLDPETVVVSVKHLAEIEGDVKPIIAAAHLMKEKEMKTFDALHAIVHLEWAINSYNP